MSKENEKIVFQGKMIEVVHETIMTDSGKEITLERGRRAPGVRLIIETLDGEFLISKEERLKVGIDYRLPGGKVFDSLVEYNDFLNKDKDEQNILKEAEQAAVRESMEEVGIKPTKMTHFYTSVCGGSFDWDLYYFIVHEYEEVGQNLGEHEKIEVLKVTKDQLKEYALTKMQEDRSVGVLLKYLNK